MCSVARRYSENPVLWQVPVFVTASPLKGGLAPDGQGDAIVPRVALCLAIWIDVDWCRSKMPTWRLHGARNDKGLQARCAV